MSINTLLANPSIINDLVPIFGGGGGGGGDNVSIGSLAFTSASLSTFSCNYILYVSTALTNRKCTIFCNNFTSAVASGATNITIASAGIPIPTTTTASFNVVITVGNSTSGNSYTSIANIATNNNAFYIPLNMLGAMVAIGDTVLLNDFSLDFVINN